MYGEPPKDEASAESLFEDLTVEQMQSEMATMAMRPVQEENWKVVQERKAKQEADRALADKAIEEGKF
jgi:high-affinity Fe2+/Pb2+ permease